MPRRWLGLLALACLLGNSLPAHSGNVDTPAQQRAQRDARRAQIALERDAENARRNAELEDCSRRFAVSACAREVEALRRSTLNRLRDEETALNDLDRQQLAQEQRARTQEKLRERAQRDADAASTPMPPSEARRAAEQQRKQADHAAALRRAAAGTMASGAEPPAGHLASSGPGAAQQADNLAAYQARLEEARKRKEAAAQRRRDAPSQGRPLPVPPATP